EARMFVAGTTPYDPPRDPDDMLDQMREISAGWLRAHHGGEKGFCMGRFEPPTPRRGWLPVGWEPGRGRREGLPAWGPGWGRRGWALDLIRRREDSAPGTTEFLIVKSVEAARARGEAMLSLSLSALARVDDTAEGQDAVVPSDAPAEPAAQAPTVEAD